MLGVAVPAYQSLTVTEAALDQLVPIEFRADLIVEFRDAGQRPVLSSVVEVQLRIDEAKHFSWPVYVAVERSRKRCETCLIVVTPDPAVAAWARRPIRIGPGNKLHARYFYEMMDRRAAHAEARAEARMLLKILDRVGIVVTDEQRRTIEACEDQAQIEHWADRAFDVKTAAELFA